MLSDEVDLPFVQANLDGLLDRSREGLKRIQKIVENLRDFAHLEEAESQEADLSAGVSATVGILHEMAARRHVSLKTELELVPKLNCYPAKINMVVQNLVLNAIDACSAGGQVVVRTRAREEAVEIEVVDDGCGIDPAIQGKSVRPILHDQTGRPGNGAGPVDELRDHQGPRRVDRLRIGAGPRHTVHSHGSFLVQTPLRSLRRFPISRYQAERGAGMITPSDAERAPHAGSRPPPVALTCAMP